MSKVRELLEKIVAIWETIKSVFHKAEKDIDTVLDKATNTVDKVDDKLSK